MAGLEQKWLCFLILIYIVMAVAQASFLHEYGEVKALNGTFKFVGESLELYCNITSTTIRENSSMLHFERNTRKDNSVIPSEYIEILSTRSIRLRLLNLSVDDDGVYTCFQKTFSGDTRVIGSHKIEVDYRPQKVKDIACRVYNWESMTCSWDLGVSFQHPEHINVSLAWTIQLPKGSPSFSLQFDCPDLKEKTSCHWDAGNYSNGHMYLMVVEVSTVVNGKNLAQENSKIFRVETQLYIEPAPVDNFRAKVRNSSCVELQWEHSAIDRHKYFVAESKVADEDKWTPIILNNNLSGLNQSLACSLTPYTNYSFRMSVLPYPVYTTEPITQGHRSPWKMVTAQTFQDVPGAAPNICLGCFTDIKCPQNHVARCVRLYWQDLRKDQKHGILTNYSITYSSSNETKHKTNATFPVENSKRLSVDLTLPTTDQTYKIDISPGTLIGFSRHSSLLLLPAVHKKPHPPPNFLVEVDEEQLGEDIIFYLSWAALNFDAKTGLKYSNVTVVWCLGNKHTKVAECKDDIHWTDVPADHVTYELKVAAEGHQHSDFLIGITAQVISDGQMVSSGIHCSTCTFHRNEKPRNAPKNVRESGKHPINGLMILWDKFECAEEDSFITEYLVRYCPTSDGINCNEPEKTVNVSNTAGEVTLENLIGDIKYIVNVMAISSAGLGPSTSLLSKMVAGSPPDEEKSYLAFICGILGVLGLLIILLLVWCCYKRRKKIQNFVYEEPMDISNKKNQDFKNRPLPKTPEEQHFYGSSACMNNPGSDKAKDNNSGSCSEESVTSQSHLLSSNTPGNHNGLSAHLEKVPKKKHRSETTKKELTKEEAKLLPNGFLSNRPNGLIVDTDIGSVSESKESTSQSDYSLLGNKDNCSRAHKSKTQSSNLDSASDKPSSLNTIHSSSQDVDDYHLGTAVSEPGNTIHSSSQDVDDYHLGTAVSEPGNTADLIDSTTLTFSNTNTLPLRGQKREMSVCPVALAVINPLSSSVFGDHRFAAELNQPATQDSDDFQNKIPSSGSTRSALQNLPNANFLPHASLPRSANSDYMPHSQIEHQSIPGHNHSLDYSRFVENSQNQRHDDSLESFSSFLPSSASSPPSPCPVDTCLSVYPASLPYLCDTQFRLPLYDTYVPDSAAMIPQHCSNNNNGYTPLDAVTKTPAAENVPACSTCLTNEPNQNLTSNVPLASSLDIYVDNIPQIDHHNGNDRPLVIKDYMYNPSTTAATIPRNASSGSATLLLPSPLSRPLSGDLLQLPLQYYEDPTLDGSNPTLTEL